MAKKASASSSLGPLSSAGSDGALWSDVEALGSWDGVEAQGSWGPTRVDLKSRGSLDLRLASSFVSQLERAQELRAMGSYPVALGLDQPLPAVVGEAQAALLQDRRGDQLVHA